MAETQTTRTLEISLDIDAAVSRVWNALTDPDQLRQWFPLMAEVDPGRDGSIRLTWGPELDGRNAIIAWEVDRYLKTSWFEPAAPDGPLAGQAERNFYADHETRRKMTVEFFLQSKGEGTELRMVHAGFPTTPDWDEEYEAHARGWIFELNSLANYLGRHDGEERHVAWVRRPLTITREQAWASLVGPSAMVRDGSLDGLAPGDRYAITTADGDRFEGRVLLMRPPTEFAGTVENLDHALLRFGVETYVEQPEASFWLSTWGEPATAERFVERWRARFDELF